MKIKPDNFFRNYRRSMSRSRRKFERIKSFANRAFAIIA